MLPAASGYCHAWRVNLIGLVDIHTYLGATPGELSFSMGVLPAASGYCHAWRVNLVGLVDTHTHLGATPGELSFSMGVLPAPDASGCCHVAHTVPVCLVVKR